MRIVMFLKRAIRRFFSKTERFEVYIGSGTVSIGNIVTAGVAKVEGKHTGNITAGSIIIMENGFVRGDLKAATAVIGGIVEGNVSADVSVGIKTHGRLAGYIFSRALMVAEGGIFEGYAKCNKNTEELPALVNNKAVVT
ncbi:MAG: polymer-forming cytoskeletal protein [Nitrospirae bacterium]|nr:polymer-forming cytoskeletal protein [Nitrospirota bacterium]